MKRFTLVMEEVKGEVNVRMEFDPPFSSNEEYQRSHVYGYACQVVEAVRRIVAESEVTSFKAERRAPEEAANG